MEEHVRLLAERYRRQGMTAEAALLAARRQFGNTTLLQEDLRAMQIIPAIEALRGDLTYAARMLRKNPGFAAAAVITLALGIGANTAIFSVCNAVLFKPLPYAEPDRIVMLSERQSDGKLGDVAPANFVDWRDASRSFSGMAAVRASSFASSFILGGQGEASRLAGGDVSSSFFSVLGVRFMLGRNFLPEEDRPGQNRVAILSYAAWSERFGADRDIAGKTITLDDESYTVVGVLPAGFQFGSTAADFQARSQADIWVPIALDPQKTAARLAYVARHREAQARSETGAGAGGVGRHGGEPRAAVPGAQQGHRDRRGAAGRSGDGECSRGTRDTAWRGWTGAADRLRQRSQPAAQPGRGAPERNGRADCVGRKPRAAGTAASDGEPVTGEPRRHCGLRFGACCYCGLNSAVACRPVTRRGDYGRHANADFYRCDFAGDRNSLRTGSLVRTVARKRRGIA